MINLFCRHSFSAAQYLDIVQYETFRMRVYKTASHDHSSFKPGGVSLSWDRTVRLYTAPKMSEQLAFAEH